MNIKYEVGVSESKPTVHLSAGGQHIGTIWGVVEVLDGDFERINNIIAINKGSKMVAMIWGATEKEQGKS